MVGGDLNPRPAGYESASGSTEHTVLPVTYDNPDSVVATLVAIKAADMTLEYLIVPDDLREVINSWNALTESVQASILTIIRATCRSISDIGDDVAWHPESDPRVMRV